MNPEQIIQDAKEKAGEWLEMSDNPDSFLLGMLSIQVWAQNMEIEYLKKRLSSATRYV